MGQQNFWQNAVHKWWNFFEESIDTFESSPPEWGGVLDRVEMLKYLDAVQNKKTGTTPLGAKVELDFTIFSQFLVYSPYNERLYFSPTATNYQSHYDIERGEQRQNESMSAPAIVSDDHTKGCFNPTLNRIYWVPTTSLLDYTDCVTGVIVEAAHGFSLESSNPYTNIVYCPTNDRMYLIPYDQSDVSNWHYIDSSGTMVEYETGTSGLTRFSSGCYSPTDNRIYLLQIETTTTEQRNTWYYIDCATNQVVSITLPFELDNVQVGTGARWTSATYAPLRDGIIFGGEEVLNWVFLDVATLTFSSFDPSQGLAISSDLWPESWGVYSPVSDRMFFGRYFLDCSTLVGNEIRATADSGVEHIKYAIYTPYEGRMYSTVGSGIDDLVYVSETSPGVDAQWAGNPLFNRGG